LGLRRYFESGLIKTPVDAMREVFKHHLDKVVADIGIQKFRDQLYYTERNDNLIKAHLPLFQEIYRMYSNHFRKPGENIDYMLSREF
jgi:hypothetical protein